MEIAKYLVVLDYDSGETAVYTIGPWSNDGWGFESSRGHWNPEDCAVDEFIRKQGHPITKTKWMVTNCIKFK